MRTTAKRARHRPQDPENLARWARSLTLQPAWVVAAANDMTLEQAECLQEALTPALLADLAVAR